MNLSGSNISTGGASAKTYVIGEFKESYGVEPLDGEKVSFNISGNTHILTLKNHTETQATIEIQSKKQTFVIVVGEGKKIDLNNDGSFDIYIKLRAVDTITKKLQITLNLASFYQ